MDGTGTIPTPASAPKAAATLDPKEKARLQKAVKDFEAIFMGMMMKSMRSTVPKDEASGESFGNDVMESMFDAEIAKKMAGRSNLGLAEMLYRSITKEPLNAPDPAASAAASAHALPVPVPATPLKITRTPALHVDPSEIPAVAPAADPSGAETSPVKTPGRSAGRTGNAGAWGAPAPSTVQRIASYENIIQEAASAHGVDSTMLKAVIAAESAGNSSAVSPKDAKGLMQLTDTTAADMGVRNVWNPRENIQGGARYLQSLMQRFPGDTKSVIASYNAGPARVEKHGGVPPIPETQAYVKRVMNYMNFFEQEEASHEGR